MGRARCGATWAFRPPAVIPAAGRVGGRDCRRRRRSRRAHVRAVRVGPRPPAPRRHDRRARAPGPVSSRRSCTSTGPGTRRSPPAGALVADRVAVLPRADRLAELRPAYGSVLEDAVTRAQAALDGLWRNPPHPAAPPARRHPARQRDGGARPGDLDRLPGPHLGLRDPGRARSRSSALEHRRRCASWCAAFRAGYETVRPWPDADAETVAALRAARHLNVLNFGLSMRRPGLDEFVARHAAPVAEWMGGGWIG